eukprot:3663861-Pleurochrysis_carterae.AAC.1
MGWAWQDPQREKVRAVRARSSECLRPRVRMREYVRATSKVPGVLIVAVWGVGWGGGSKCTAVREARAFVGERRWVREGHDGCAGPRGVRVRVRSRVRVRVRFQSVRVHRRLCARLDIDGDAAISIVSRRFSEGHSRRIVHCLRSVLLQTKGARLSRVKRASEESEWSMRIEHNRFKVMRREVGDTR